MYRLLVPSQLLRNLANDIQKKFLNNVIQSELEPIRNRRKMWEKNLPDVYDILKKGSAAARETAAKTLDDVRHSMRIDYFTEDNLLK